MKNMKIHSFKEALGFLEKAGIKFTPLTGVRGDIDTVDVIYRGVRFPLIVPTVTPLGDDTFGEIVEVGEAHEGPDGLVRTRRIFHPTLNNSEVRKLRRFMAEEDVKSVLASGSWFVTGFWNAYAEALAKAHFSAEAMPRLSSSWAASLFNKNVQILLASLELVKSDAHAQAHGRVWVLAYPGRDTAQSHGGAIISDRLSPEVVEYTRRAFHKFAAEHRCDIITTGKGHPGRKVVFAPKGVSPSLSRLWVWPNFGCQARSPREMFTGVPNAQQFVNDRGVTPRVTSLEGGPDFLSGRIKFVNAAFLSFDEVVTKDPDGKPLNVDQVLGTGWSHIDGMFDSHRDETLLVPFKGESVEDIKAAFGTEYVTKVSRPVGNLQEVSWQIIRRATNRSSRGWKALNPDAVKGMVIPERALLLEKRDNEDFFRPIYLVFASEAVVKKEASRSVLRMLASRLPQPKQFDPATPREKFGEVLAGIRGELKEIGDSGYSRIFRLLPVLHDEHELIKSALEVKVLGFTEGVDEAGEPIILPIGENEVGTLHGGLVPVMDGTSEAKAVVGEMPIMRMPEDEQFGEELRLDVLHNGIRMDPFMVLGKDELEFPKDEKISELLDFEARLARAIEQQPVMAARELEAEDWLS